jgi:2-polyprenyl-3-methyl-5-hydroxy-6-metoxy-1,4-benzoquinol methylase
MNTTKLTHEPDGPAPNLRQSQLKKIVRSVLSRLGLSVRTQVTPGVSLLGFNVFSEDRNGPARFRSAYAMDYAISLKPKTVIDVGSGGGYHADQFRTNGSEVTCVDYGTSIYATESKINDLRVINVDFSEFAPKEKYDLVWASHVLEHQRNVGTFLEKLIECCSYNGHVAITLPDPHRTLWGGHLTQWSPGLLAYNVALCGIDLSDSVFIRGTNEFSLFFRPKQVSLPRDLTYDYGDLTKISAYLPQQFNENSDPWNVQYRDR